MVVLFEGQMITIHICQTRVADYIVSLCLLASPQLLLNRLVCDARHTSMEAIIKRESREMFGWKSRGRKSNLQLTTVQESCKGTR